MTAGREVADAVLSEGYVLYPYRASSTKNRYRWIFGVIAPRVWTVAGGCEPSWLETQLLVRARGDASVECTVRFLQVRRRRVEQLIDGRFVPVESLACADRLLVTWDEGVTRERAVQHLLSQAESTHVVTLDAERTEEELREADGTLRGRVVREEAAIRLQVHVRSHRVGEALGKLTVHVENVSLCDDVRASRDAVMPSCCVGTHLLLTVSDGEFLSVLDPPDWAAEETKRCRSTRAHPVLLGPSGRADAVLASPIILYDFPRIAPESPGDFYDAAEIDELLALRTANLTPAEKREARATDERAAAIVDRVDSLPPEMMERLHGALRDLENAEMVPRRSHAAFAPGSRVRLRPGARRTDAQDLLYAGRIARVEAIKQDVDGRECLAVTIEDDPAADLHRWKGRYHYFYPDEVEPLPAEEVAP